MIQDRLVVCSDNAVSSQRPCATGVMNAVMSHEQKQLKHQHQICNDDSSFFSSRLSLQVVLEYVHGRRDGRYLYLLMCDGHVRRQSGSLHSGVLAAASRPPVTSTSRRSRAHQHTHPSQIHFNHYRQPTPINCLFSSASSVRSILNLLWHHDRDPSETADTITKRRNRPRGIAREERITLLFMKGSAGADVLETKTAPARPSSSLRPRAHILPRTATLAGEQESFAIADTSPSGDGRWLLPVQSRPISLPEPATLGAPARTPPPQRLPRVD